MKLTKLQLKALGTLARYPVDKFFMPATVRRLVRIGLAEKRVSFLVKEFAITEAGRRAATDGETKP